MIRLDTHVVVWLDTGEVERLNESAVDALERHVPVASPIVQLELTYCTRSSGSPSAAPG